MRQINDHLKINRNTSNSFPHIIDGFCLQAEETKKKTNFCVHFDFKTINIYLKWKNFAEEKPS